LNISDFYKNFIETKTLILILTFGFLLRCLGLFYPYLYEWDERYHALVAKHLAENPLLPLLYKTVPLPYHIEHWASNHIWLHKPPMALWIMALSIKSFGANEIAVKLPSIILSTISIYLTFRIALFFSEKKIALLAAFFQSINGLLLELTFGAQATDHVDTIFLFFVELCVFIIIIYIKKSHIWYLLLLGVALGMAILTKWLTALIVLPLFITLLFPIQGFRKVIIDTFMILLIAAIIVMPWQWYIFSYFPAEARWESDYNWRHITEVLEGHDGAWWWHILYASKYWNELIVISFIWFLFSIKTKPLRSKTLTLALWVLIPYIIFSLVATKMVAYPLITAPAIFIILAMFWYHLKANPIHIKSLNTFILILIISLSLRRSFERVQLALDIDAVKKKSTWVKEIKNVIEDKNAIIFNTESYIEIMFYHDYLAYPYTPESKVLQHLIEQGYSVYINQEGNLSKFKN
jgi:4-amino-4-deoxy-L-arabinose transferase-like glycosyltransferase